MRKKKLPQEFFQYEDISKFLTLLKKNVNAVRKNLGKFEEPYSEVSQNHKNITVKVVLPDVIKSDLQLKMRENIVEIKAEQRKKKGTDAKTLYRYIDLPSVADTKKAVAQYKNNKLKIIIPRLRL